MGYLGQGNLRVLKPDKGGDRDVNSALIGLHLKGARNQPTLQDSQSIKIQKTKDMSNKITHKEDNCGGCRYCCSRDTNACKSSEKIEENCLLLFPSCVAWKNGS